MRCASLDSEPSGKPAGVGDQWHAARRDAMLLVVPQWSGLSIHCCCHEERPSSGVQPPLVVRVYRSVLCHSQCGRPCLVSTFSGRSFLPGAHMVSLRCWLGGAFIGFSASCCPCSMQSYVGLLHPVFISGNHGEAVEKSCLAPEVPPVPVTLDQTQISPMDPSLQCPPLLWPLEPSPG